jgi:hypothetical protein
MATAVARLQHDVPLGRVRRRPRGRQACPVASKQLRVLADAALDDQATLWSVGGL